MPTSVNRILMVLRPDRGGAFNHVVALAQAFDRAGLEVEVCGPLEHRQEALSAPVHQIEIPRAVAPLALLGAAWRFAREIRRFRPDLIHAHGSQGSLVARLARVASPRTPVICTPHLYPFDNYFADAWHKRLYRAVERCLAPLATRVICVCKAEQANAASVGPADRTRVVYNGVDPVSVSNAHPAFNGSDPAQTICTIAELRESKGVQTLLEAFALVVREHPRAHLVIAGDGENRGALEAQTQALGLEGSVSFIGVTDGPAAVLGGASIFVNPAWAEAFPYSIIEAMSAGRAIVVTDVGGSAEAIIDGETGLVVAPREAGALADALSSLLAAPETRAKLGGRALERYRETFTLDQMIEGTLAVYREVGTPTVETIH